MRKDIYERMKLMKAEEIRPNYAELARRYDCDYRTVKKYFTTEENQIKARYIRPSKIDPFVEIVTKKFQMGCTVKSIFYFIKKKGFTGSYTRLKVYCKKLKDEEVKKATIRFETNPGLQAQVDWKESVTMISKRGELFVVNIFLMILGFSRMKYLQLTFDKSQNTLFECMINACQYFDGVPKEIIFDNMRTVVDQSRSNYQDAVINDKFYQFSKDMGFEVWACRPYRPQTKGKVEALAKLMSRIEPYNEEFETPEELNQIVIEVNNELNTEISQAINCPPFTRWKKEKEYLLQLPNQELLDGYFQIPITRTVSKESMVVYKYNKYSLDPKYIGKTVTLKVEGLNLNILFNGIIVASHQVTEKKYNYRFEDYTKILKSDVFRFRPDDEINNYAKEQLALYDKF